MKKMSLITLVAVLLILICKPFFKPQPFISQEQEIGENMIRFSAQKPSGSIVFGIKNSQNEIIMPAIFTEIEFNGTCLLASHYQDTYVYVNKNGYWRPEFDGRPVKKLTQVDGMEDGKKVILFIAEIGNKEYLYREQYSTTIGPCDRFVINGEYLYTLNGGEISVRKLNEPLFDESYHKIYELNAAPKRYFLGTKNGICRLYSAKGEMLRKLSMTEAENLLDKAWDRRELYPGIATLRIKGI